MLKELSLSSILVRWPSALRVKRTLTVHELLHTAQTLALLVPFFVLGQVSFLSLLVDHFGAFGTSTNIASVIPHSALSIEQSFGSVFP